MDNTPTKEEQITRLQQEAEEYNQLQAKTKVDWFRDVCKERQKLINNQILRLKGIKTR